MPLSSINPKRGEVWQVDLDPTVGSEIQKSRPCVVMSADGVGRLPVRLVVPLTGWKPAYGGYPWCVQVTPDAASGLTKVSAADTFQMWAVSVLRMSARLGELPEATMAAIAKAVAVCVDYEP
jgi:mRNA interferase MazF